MGPWMKKGCESVSELQALWEKSGIHSTPCIIPPKLDATDKNPMLIGNPKSPQPDASEYERSEG